MYRKRTTMENTLSRDIMLESTSISKYNISAIVKIKLCYNIYFYPQNVVNNYRTLQKMNSKHFAEKHKNGYNYGYNTHIFSSLTNSTFYRFYLNRTMSYNRYLMNSFPKYCRIINNVCDYSLRIIFTKYQGRVGWPQKQCRKIVTFSV